MIKVGVLLNSTTGSKYLHNTICELAQNESIELYYLLHEDEVEAKGTIGKITEEIKTKGLSKFVDHAVFKIISSIESKLLSFINKDIREHAKSYDLEGFSEKNIYLNPSFSKSKLLVRYEEKEIDKIKALELDIIIRGNASGIFRGEILRSAKEGIISFHHGDNRWNRGGPPGFWEVYRRNPSTGFIIQILSEDLDGGDVIARGNLPTSRTYMENKINLYNVSNPYLSKIISDYAETKKLPATEKKMPYAGKLLTIPSVGKSLIYFLKTASLMLNNALQKVLNKHERWGVAFQAKPWRNAVLRKGTIIKNPPDRFLADPFIITKNNRTICFVEDFNYSQKKGRITAIEIFGDNKYEILGPVIEEAFHMSFPYLFSFENELYMIPETSANETVQIYKCIDFPMNWEFEKKIKHDCFTVDSMLFEHEERWWLFTNNANTHETEVNATLSAFYSDSPLSDTWTPHDKNPLVFDSARGRNAGLLRNENGLPVRGRQKQGFNAYGKGMSLAQITNLSPTQFEEEKIGQITPDFFLKIKKCHHLHSNGEYTVYDYARTEYLKKNKIYSKVFILLKTFMINFVRIF